MKPNQLNPVTSIFTGLFVLYLVLTLSRPRVKSSGVRQSQIYKWPEHSFGSEGVKLGGARCVLSFIVLLSNYRTCLERYRVSPPSLLTLASVMSF